MALGNAAVIDVFSPSAVRAMIRPNGSLTITVLKVESL